MAYDPEKKVYIGELEKRGETVRFGIRDQDRARHVYVIGQTGTGKSTLLEIMAAQDIANGDGLIFMDPHGQSVEHLLEYVDESRIDDVIYFAPHLQDRPTGLNIMEDIGYDRRHLVVSSLIASFHKIWGEGTWSDRMEYILSNTLLALIEYPNTTLLDIGRMYTSKSFRDQVIANIKDPQVKKYWTEEFAQYTDRYMQEATPAIQNKIGQFTSNPLIRNIVGQSKSAFDFRKIMDEGKVLLVNLSKGQIGENNARMLGVLFTTKIYLSALSRSDLSRDSLDTIPPCNFYVDEFQSFANSSFSGILSEARKYKLHLVLAHQFIGQLYSDDSGAGNAIRDAVFGNVGTFVSFRVGAVDAEIISKQFAPVFTEEDLVALPNRHMYLTLNIDGTVSVPFSARTFTMPDPPPTSLVDEVVKRSMERYGADREAVEAMVRENLEADQKEKVASGGKPGGKGGERRGPAHGQRSSVKKVFQKIQDSLPSSRDQKPQEQKPARSSERKGRSSGGERREKRAGNSQNDRKPRREDASHRQERGRKEGDGKGKEGGLGGLVDQARSSGLPKDLRAKPKQEKPTPEIHYEDGWVSLTDIQKTHAKPSKDDGE